MISFFLGTIVGFIAGVIFARVITERVLKRKSLFDAGTKSISNSSK